MIKQWDIHAYEKKAREAAAEGIVLLKNDGAVLPFQSGVKLALFGRTQLNYFKSGTGSGGMVNTAYVNGIKEGLLEDDRFILDEELMTLYTEWVKDHPFDAGHGWATEPWFQEEMPITDDLAAAMAKKNDAALIIIGRTAGEDKDSTREEGSYYLTKEEKQMLKAVCSAFDKTVVFLNIGSIIDMNWVEEFAPSAVLIGWQGGQIGGNSAADVLIGDVNPSGHLSDTIAKELTSYGSDKNFGGAQKNLQQEDIYVGYRYFETFDKESVLYPFGFGLSYTCFDMETVSLEKADDKVTVTVKVTNTGKVAGKEVAQVYVEAPQGKLGKAARSLTGFAKTVLLAAGESETLTITMPLYTMASYDETGKTGYKSSYVLEEGTYTFYVGNNVRCAKASGSMEITETLCVAAHSEQYAPAEGFSRIKPGKQKENGSYEIVTEDVPTQTKLSSDKRAEAMPEEIPFTDDQGYKLKDVYEGKISLDTFVAQLNDHDLICMMRGEGMCSPKVTAGIAGCFGGVTEHLRSFGIPVAGVSDGPSGIRMDCGSIAFAMPNGTCLACTWNEQLNYELYEWEGLELRKNRIESLLGPGMNIHRHPLNGRNFEYFSEDPLLTGKMAASQLRGMHAYGVTGTIKHFCGNTQETGRNSVDSVMSERALREIYLKGFEIAVKEGQADSIMSTYGPVNGIWTASSYDLLTGILRNEWGFDGIVMTDWWAKGNDYAGAEGTLANVAAQVRAQNDLNMVNTNADENSNGDNLDKALQDGRLTRAELQRSAKNILRFLLHTPVFYREMGQKSEMEEMLSNALNEEETAIQNMALWNCEAEGDGSYSLTDPAEVDTAKGKTKYYSIQVAHRGLYKLSLTMKANFGGENAQIPVSIFQNRDLLETITITGKQTDWITREVTLQMVGLEQFFLKLFFGEAGMGLKEIRLTLVKDLEEEIRRAREAK